MQNRTRIIRSFTLAGLLVLAGCSFPGVHKIDIQQGNVVSQDMVDQLLPGMTTRQVRFIMGTPLITDTFHSNRWDYLYSIQLAGGTRKQERISLIFDENNQQQGLSGDYVPGISRDQAILGQSKKENPVGEPPAVSTETLQVFPQNTVQAPTTGSLHEQIHREIDDIEVATIPESRVEDDER